MAQGRWRRLDGAHLLPLVRARAGFQPLFPRYVFVGIAPEASARPISGTRGVQYIVHFGAHPAQVPLEVVRDVSARMDDTYVKVFVEEREMTVMLVVDLSGSERFGTVKRFKSELASELAAVLAMSAVQNNDRVGVLLFTDRIEHVVPPRKGRRHVLRIIRDLLAFEPVGRGTDMVTAIDYVAKMLNQKAIVFIVSDFLEADISHPLKILAQRHDVVAVTVEDPSERDLPDIGIARLIDPETGDTFEVDTSSSNVREAYSERVAAEREERKHLLRRLAIDEVSVRTEGGVVEPLLRFFRARETRLRR